MASVGGTRVEDEGDSSAHIFGQCLKQSVETKRCSYDQYIRSIATTGQRIILPSLRKSLTPVSFRNKLPPGLKGIACGEKL
jgi:hypothetical protein